jgi:hypothetical protein
VLFYAIGMGVFLPTLTVSRRPRHAGTPWAGATSWFGGDPRMGSLPWPRSKKTRRPMTFVAQIDLSEIAATAGTTALPGEGALAFFVGGTEGGTVLEVAPAGARIPTSPPSDASVALADNGEVLPYEADAVGDVRFPYWPVDLTALQIRDDADEEELAAAVRQRFARRQYFFSAREAYKALGITDKPCWWHSAQLYAKALLVALRSEPRILGYQHKHLEPMRAKVAKLKGTGVTALLGLMPRAQREALKKAQEELAKAEGRLAELERLMPLFDAFVREVSDWVEGRNPWQPMARADSEQLEIYHKRGLTRFERFVRYGTPGRLDGFETATLLALMTTADEKAHAALPQAMRALINEHYLLPTGPWHQMFGRGVDIQGNAAAENEGNLMLLQLVYDDMINWQFGDMGAFQFWIAPEDLRRRNWGAVRVTFECH